MVEVTATTKRKVGRPSYPIEVVEQVIALWNDGLSYRRIMAITGIKSTRSINQYLHRYSDRLTRKIRYRGYDR